MSCAATVLLLFIWVLACPSADALTADESPLLNRVRSLAAAPLDDFSVLGGSTGLRDGHYRYQIAFLSYGLCSVIVSDPALRNEARELFTRLVERMQRPETTQYWRALGYPAERMDQDNAMYRGHLNLMYALARDRFGLTNFDARFHVLSAALYADLGAQHPVCCEPDQLFVQCNSVIVLSLFLHDRAFGTAYAATGKQLLAWAHAHMPLAGTSLVGEDYHPSTGKSALARAGYANAWTIAFLAAVPGLQDEIKPMYADWRRVFVDPTPSTPTNSASGTPALRLDEMLCSGLPLMTFGFCAAVRGAPAGERLSPQESLLSGLLATTFGLLAARAEDDEALHQRLERTVAGLDLLAQAYEPYLPAERRAQARTFRTIGLFARAFRGWNAVLGANAKPGR